MRINKKLTIKYKLAISVFESLNKAAYSTQARSLGTSRNVVNTILSHDTFCDTVLPIIIGNNSKNSEWEREKSDYISSIQISVPASGLVLDLNATFNKENSITKEAIAKYIEEHRLFDIDEKEVKTVLSDEKIVDHIFANSNLSPIDYHRFFRYDNFKDYLYWIICLTSSQVANVAEDVMKSQNIRFFLYDEKIAKRHEMDASKLELDALNKLAAIKAKDNAKSLLRSIIIAKDILPFDELEEITEVDDLYLHVFTYAKQNPSQFVAVAGNKDIAYEARVKSYIDLNIFRISEDGNIVESANGNNIIGSDLQAAISYFKNPINKAEVTKFEGLYKSYKNK